LIRGGSLRWRLVAWVSGVLLLGLAVTFAVVYVQTGTQLRRQIDTDVSGDLRQLTETARSLPASRSGRLAQRLRAYVRTQPFAATSSLLFAVIPGHGTVSNHPELFGDDRSDDGESVAEQTTENAQGDAVLHAGDGLHTLVAPDVGPTRIGVRTIVLDGARVRLGAGEPLTEVARAQRGVARAFLLAGAIALALVLIASYLAAAAVLAPLQRLSRIAERVDDGDLAPRMVVAPSAGREIRVLADAFNHMLDRLADAFLQQRAFVADASHELRTPLTVIAGQLEVLAAQHAPRREDIDRVSRLVSAEVGRTARLIDDLLILARSDEQRFLTPTPIELRGFVEDLWTATTTGRQRQFVLGPVPDRILFADPDRLAQAMRNLIINAIAHTDAPDGRVELLVHAFEAGFCFTVIDDGPGIPASERAHVFERFYRSDRGRARADGGTGLGLAIVQAIAVAHGGLARAVTPVDGRGARVQLVIPGRGPSSA
jgi:two-component system OmpR family sensor kinase